MSDGPGGAPVVAAIRSRDPISQAGVTAQLASTAPDDTGPPVVVVTEQDVTPHVLVIVGDTVDDWLLAQLDALAGGAGPAPRPVLVVGHLDDTAGLRAVEAGGLSLVRRSESTAPLLREVVRSAARGEARLPPDLLSSLLTQVGRTQRDVLAPRGLTILSLSPRQLAVLRMIAAGADVATIARELSYSERSIKHIVHEITTRLGVRNRTQAVAHAIRAGLI
ncbi:helix-turn-helix transcriptional regulator [Polymorphospora rubra]|uniref:Helix-turn-helix transcriptional regulator n=1 Tax=Polymorphospora rubra TaxID=338584 RepID=A0A810MSI3_9ACTN|nr:LuxR C-terminal-related transcriptional regulator [Polymorphospora rubra]BCJ63912.1 helix-turn-helix transcriptional regulator [Polymorphospora rubra]